VVEDLAGSSQLLSEKARFYFFCFTTLSNRVLVMNICCPICFGMIESNGLEDFIHYGLYISLIPLLRKKIAIYEDIFLLETQLLRICS